MSGRYYCGNEVLHPGREIYLPADESRHLLKVMRARPGAGVLVFCEQGQFAATLIGTSEPGLARLAVGDPVPAPQPPSVRMQFLVPWIKGGKTELLVQKLTELGACRIIAFQTRREVARGDEAKTDRLRRVALEACKQCERIDVPAIDFAMSLSDAMGQCESIPSQCRIILHERQGSNLLSRVVIPALEVKRELLVASGPEGGWHPDELEAVRDQVVLVSMGARILRAETAPLAAAAAILTLAGDI